MKPAPPVTSLGAGCSVLTLRTFVTGTSMAGILRCFRKNRSIIEQVERHFRQLMRGINFWELDRMQATFTALCMLLLNRELKLDDYYHKRSNLVVRFMQFADCVTPMMVHQMLEKLMEDLEKHGVASEANILQLATRLSELGYPGRVLGVCLLWTVLGRRLPALEITMYRFRETGELVEAMKSKPPTIPTVWVSDDDDDEPSLEAENLLVLLEAMNLLLHLLLRCNNEELKSEGYPDHFFAVEESDCNYLSEWCFDVAKELPESLGGADGRFGRPLNDIIGMLIVDKPDEKEAEQNVEELLVEVEVALNLIEDDG